MIGLINKRLQEALPENWRSLVKSEQVTARTRVQLQECRVAFLHEGMCGASTNAGKGFRIRLNQTNYSKLAAATITKAPSYSIKCRFFNSRAPAPSSTCPQYSGFDFSRRHCFSRGSQLRLGGRRPPPARNWHRGTDSDGALGGGQSHDALSCSNGPSAGPVRAVPARTQLN